MEHTTQDQMVLLNEKPESGKKFVLCHEADLLTIRRKKKICTHDHVIRYTLLVPG